MKSTTYLFDPAVITAYGMPGKTELPPLSSKPLTVPWFVRAVGNVSPLRAHLHPACLFRYEDKARPKHVALSITSPNPIVC